MTTRPGEILCTEFIESVGITAYQLAKALHLPGLYEIARGQCAIRLRPCFAPRQILRHDPRFWMNLQTDYDLRLAATTAPLGKIKTPCNCVTSIYLYAAGENVSLHQLYVIRSSSDGAGR